MTRRQLHAVKDVIRVPTTLGFKEVRVRAVLSSLAIHRSLYPFTGHWTITHIPTGRVVWQGIPGLREAELLAGAVSKVLPWSDLGTSEQFVKAFQKIPEPIARWMKLLRAEYEKERAA